jgi:EPS-associated MarR family transcriptional regulator
MSYELSFTENYLTVLQNLHNVHPMNNSYEQELRYHLLKILENEPDLNQREMAKKMGISLGKVNYCLAELAKRGFIKITRFTSSKNKRRYSYLLTFKGLEEKARLTLNFLKRKTVEYEHIKRQIEQLTIEVENNKSAHRS